MLRKTFLIVCLVALTSVAFAGSIPISGSGGSGTIQTGQPFAYNGDGGGIVEPNWGIPGVNLGAPIWNGPTVNEFMVTFTLPAGVSIDPAQIDVGNNSGCFGTSFGGTAFCAGPYSAPWTATLIGTNGIDFTSSGDLLVQ